MGKRILDIGWGFSELVDIKGDSRNEQRVVGLAVIKGGINRIQKILKGVAGIKSILAILRGVYGVMGPIIISMIIVAFLLVVMECSKLIAQSYHNYLHNTRSTKAQTIKNRK